MKSKIFVYGTLRKGMYNYDQYLRDEESFRGFAYIKGSLMTILTKVYPAYLTEGSDMILGEIHEVTDKTLEAIDELEGFTGYPDPKNEYNKEICDIYDEDGQIIDRLPVYVYNMDNPDNLILLGDDIPSHDYVQYIQQRREGKKSLFDFDMEDE